MKSGFVTLVGRPNVGKSTLVNQLLGQKIAAVSPRPQTTRRRQLGILTTDEYQIIFMDTPGIHKASDKLDQFMNDEARETLLDADLVVWIVDASVPPQPEDDLVAGTFLELGERLPDVILLLNKVDLLDSDTRAARLAAYSALFPAAQPLQASALRGEGQDELLEMAAVKLPEGPYYYDPDQITDLYERDIASDLIRQTCLNMLREEVPHGIAVRVDEFAERDNDLTYIHATILVERESHKGIVIGKGAAMLKKIGTQARKEIEEMGGYPVYLDLQVKVNKNWRNKPEILQFLGYSLKRGK
ncbi:MAG: GTPase Era [Anaerolineae bacterium]|nr:GTPase Era [Anaerolineae bacterium]